MLIQPFILLRHLYYSSFVYVMLHKLMIYFSLLYVCCCIFQTKAMWREQHCPSFKNDSNRTRVLVHSIRQTYNVCVPVCAHVHSHMHACPCEYVCSAGHVICISSLCVHYRQDPLVNLNYTVFLYNRGERKMAAKQFSMFEQKHKAQGQVEIDSEVRMAHIISNCVCTDRLAHSTRPLL